MSIRLVSLLLLLLPLTACGQAAPDAPDAGRGAVEDPSSATPTPDDDPSATPADDGASATPLLASDAQRCTDDVLGYSIAYPDGWTTNDGEVMPSCRLFDPEPIEVEAGTEVPLDTAVMLQATERELSEFADADLGASVLSTGRTTVDGHEALVIEKRGTGAALIPEDVRFTQYVVDLGARRLVASTFDMDGSFESNRRALAAMVQSLEVIDDGEADETDETDEEADEGADEEATAVVSVPAPQHVCSIDLSQGEQVEFAPPEGWQVDQDDCRFFDPHRDELPADTEPDVAMSVRVSDVAFTDALSEGPATRDEVTYVGAVAGRAMARVRAVATGEGQRPEGAPSLSYVVDLGGDGDQDEQSLVATASASEGVSFPLAALALDATVRTLRISPAAAGAEQPVVTRRVTGPAPYTVTFDHECFRLHRPGPTDAPVDEACKVSFDGEPMVATVLEDGDLEVAAGLAPPRAAFVVSDAASAPYGAVTMSLEGATAFAYEVVGSPTDLRALDRRGNQLATTTTP